MPTVGFTSVLVDADVPAFLLLGNCVMDIISAMFIWMPFATPE